MKNKLVGGFTRYSPAVKVELELQLLLHGRLLRLAGFARLKARFETVLWLESVLTAGVISRETGDGKTKKTSLGKDAFFLGD